MAITTDTYWRSRHRRHNTSMRSVGCRVFREKANEFVYRLVRERYEQVLDRLTLPASTQVLDAGAGTGEFIPVFLQRNWGVAAIDVSREALHLLTDKHPSVRTEESDIIHMPFREKEFDIVHCFDVLYHITEKKDWEASIRALCRTSKKHVILHGLFPRSVHGITPSHIQHKSYNEYAKIFHEEGFRETHSTHTHIIGLKFPLYYIQNLFPRIFYCIDNNLHKIFSSKKGPTALHTIKVFTRT
ncbi:class I SAM-dependent methyltransferase [Patescibacteria group bacterium]